MPQNVIQSQVNFFNELSCKGLTVLCNEGFKDTAKVYTIYFLSSVFKVWKVVFTYKSHVTVTSLNASDAMFVSSSSNSSLNRTGQNTNSSEAHKTRQSTLGTLFTTNTKLLHLTTLDGYGLTEIFCNKYFTKQLLTRAQRQERTDKTSPLFFLTEVHLKENLPKFYVG